MIHQWTVPSLSFVQAGHKITEIYAGIQEEKQCTKCSSATNSSLDLNYFLIYCFNQNNKAIVIAWWYLHITSINNQVNKKGKLIIKKSKG